MAITIQKTVFDTPTSEFVSWNNLQVAIEEAFDQGRHLADHPTYSGIFRTAYDAAKEFGRLGAELRGSVDANTYLGSILQAAHDGYLEGGEKQKAAPRQGFVPVLIDPNKTAIEPLMNFITAAYVRGFDIGKASYRAAGIDNASRSGGMLGTDSSWGSWLLGTLVVAGVVVAGAVIIRGEHEKGKR